MTGKKLTKRQQEILDYLKSEIREKGYPPSVREICEAVNLKSTSSVHAHLHTLEKNEYIRRDPAHPRAIEITDGSFIYENRREITDVPVIGYVAAGQPLFAEQNIEGQMPVASSLLPSGECFMLKVRGESMIGAGILDGDYVIVQKQNTAENGEIVVALVEDSATVKRFYKENGGYRLQPENEAMEPIIVSACIVLGKVIGVMRFMK